LPGLPNHKIEKEIPDLMGKLGMKSKKNRGKKKLKKRRMEMKAKNK
jgi:hypothetical protein